MSYASWSVVFGEQPSAAKWNILGTNDASFNDGTGIANLEIGSGHTSMKLDYKFAAYRNAAQTDGSGAFAKINFDTKLFDTGSNYDATTNFRFTAPVNGFYQFNARVTAGVTAGTTCLLALFKNGSQYSLLQQMTTAAGNLAQNGSAFISLNATDYIEVDHWGTGGALQVGVTNGTYFEGFLVSQT